MTEDETRIARNLLRDALEDLWRIQDTMDGPDFDLLRAAEECIRRVYNGLGKRLARREQRVRGRQ